MFSLIWDWMNGWVNNREAGDLRRHRAHYDVTIMIWPGMQSCDGCLAVRMDKDLENSWEAHGRLLWHQSHHDIQFLINEWFLLILFLCTYSITTVEIQCLYSLSQYISQRVLIESAQQVAVRTNDMPVKPYSLPWMRRHTNNMKYIDYRKISNIRPLNLNASRLVLHLPLPNPLKLGI